MSSAGRLMRGLSDTGRSRMLVRGESALSYRGMTISCWRAVLLDSAMCSIADGDGFGEVKKSRVKIDRRLLGLVGMLEVNDWEREWDVREARRLRLECMLAGGVTRQLRR
jgi:hypothetical protein